ncbi:MAG: spermidine/putrescine ABC transporter substrate-binding protein [Clostridiales bacterium]|nr:spermidine/putrescine ABC transporter substrate-binding protein [Clostridiales bacterium]
MSKRNSVVLIVVSVLLVAFLVSCGKSSQPQEINLMTWGGDFVPREIINEFEAETGIKVNYKEMQSNEDMQSVLEANPGQYDLAVVTDYMVDILRQNGILEKFDKSKMPNFKNINPVYQNNYYDETNEYSIPYAVSTSFLLVNPGAIEELGAKPITGYKDMWQEELKDNIVVIDWSVEIIGLVLKSLGYEYNETDPKKVQEAKEKLFELKDHIMRFETNTPEDSLISGEAVVGFMYSNQAVKGQAEDERLQPVFPEEGMPIYIDSFVMSKDAPNKDGSYQLLNFLMDPEISARISELTKFTNANKEAEKYLSDEFKNNIMLNIPDEIIENTSFYIDVADVLEEYEHIYSEFKMQ